MHEALRLFSLCDAMKWNHLPVAGGLYDQHPMLLDSFAVIFSIRSEHERKEQAKQANKSGHGAKPTRKPARRGKRR